MKRSFGWSYPTARTAWPPSIFSLGFGIVYEECVHREAEDERIAARQAAAHLLHVLPHTLVEDRRVFLRVAERLLQRLRPELRERIGPQPFVRRALMRDRLDPVADHRAGILVDRPLDDALVVVDEEARRLKDVDELLFHLVELESRCDRIRRAAAEASLVVDGRTGVAQIDRAGKRPEVPERRFEHPIALVGKIRNPAVPLGVACFRFHGVCDSATPTSTAIRRKHAT